MHCNEANTLEGARGVATAVTASAIDDYGGAFRLELIHPTLELLNRDIDGAVDMAGGELGGRANVDEPGSALDELTRFRTAHVAGLCESEVADGEHHDHDQQNGSNFSLI